MQVYNATELQADPLFIFHQADMDSVFVLLDGNKYEIRQILPAKSPLDVSGLSEFHQTLKAQPAVTIDSILDDIQAGRDKRS